MKNIYLDIDGTLICDGLNNFGMPAPHLKDFLQALNSGKYTVYWLTTHCREGDLTRVHAYLQRFLPKDLFELVREYKPTIWDELKTDAIDFSRDFLWFDDDAIFQEKEVLCINNSETKLIEINLHDNPNQLKEIAEAIL